MIRIGIILGSTRPGRNGEQVAAWVHDTASRRTDAEFELIDLRDHPLPTWTNRWGPCTAGISTRTRGPGRPGSLRSTVSS